MVERAAPAAEQRLSVLLGDDALARAHHTSRHNRVVRAWVEAKAAVHGAAQTRATADAPAYSYPSVPDFVTEFAGQASAHLIGEVKVYNPIRADMTEMRRGAVRPFGATEPQLRSEILGAGATDECATRALTRYYISGPRRGTPRVAKYAVALRGGHRVVPLIAEVWGGFAVDAMSFLRYSRVAGDLYLARS